MKRYILTTVIVAIVIAVFVYSWLGSIFFAVASTVVAPLFALFMGDLF